MRLVGRVRAHLVRSPVYLLLSAGEHHPSTDRQTGVSLTKSQLRGRSGGGRHLLGGSDSGETRGLRSWLQLVRRRIVVACRPRNIARIFGALLVATLLVIIVTKGYSSRLRNACKCAKFAYSQCQPYEGECGQGIKKAFCQQKKCQPRRKVVRCSVACGATKAGATGDAGLLHAVGCTYAVRRQSIWTKCSAGVKHRSRLLFLQAESPEHCPATRTERRPCKSEAVRPTAKSCHYESKGSWTPCSKERNEIVNIRKLIDGSVSDCPMELREATRCLKRDGSLKCIYSHWTKWSQCSGGSRHKTRALIQGSECEGEATRLEQNCPRTQTTSQTIRARGLPGRKESRRQELINAIIRK